MVGKFTALKTWRLFNIHFFFECTIEECTFDIYLLDCEVHVSGKGKRGPNCFKSGNWSKGAGEDIDGMDKEGLFWIGIAIDTEASLAREDVG
ncbi:hypothetical protein Tco_0494082 [Tanacetum coccineum]